MSRRASGRLPLSLDARRFSSGAHSKLVERRYAKEHHLQCQQTQLRMFPYKGFSTRTFCVNSSLYVKKGGKDDI